MNVTKPVHRSSVCCRSPPSVQLSVCSGTGKRGSGSVEQFQDLWNYFRISCLFVQVLKRENHDLWNNFNIWGIISGSVVCLFMYWEDQDLWNNFKICGIISGSVVCFFQVLEREDHDLWNNFKIWGIISGSVVCLFRYWQEGDHDLWNNLRICREKSFDINASLLLCWIGQGAKHNIRDTKISVVRVGCQSSMSYYDIVMLVLKAAPPTCPPSPTSDCQSRRVASIRWHAICRGGCCEWPSSYDLVSRSGRGYLLVRGWLGSKGSKGGKGGSC